MMSDEEVTAYCAGLMFGGLAADGLWLYALLILAGYGWLLYATAKLKKQKAALELRRRVLQAQMTRDMQRHEEYRGEIIDL